jgi:fructoselysine 6-kinase
MNVACVGDCGIDRYVSLGVERPGGITFNVASHLRRCLPAGTRVTIITAVGNDPAAAIVRDALSRSGCESSVTVLEGATPIQYIELEPSGEKHFLKYDEGVLRAFRIAAREREIVAGSDLLATTVFKHVEGLFDSVMAIPSAGLRAVDFTDLRGVGDGLELVSRYVDRFDIGFFGLRADQTQLVDGLERIAAASGRLFVVTLGADGSMALGSNRRIFQPAVHVDRVVDTTGAGDSFAAGFLAEYCASRDVTSALERGASEAAHTIQHLGASEPGTQP